MRLASIETTLLAALGGGNTPAGSSSRARGSRCHSPSASRRGLRTKFGLFKISAPILEKVKRFYSELDRDAVYLNRSFMDMEMAAFIQLVIDRLLPVHAVRIRGRWLEIDAASDLELAWPPP